MSSRKMKNFQTIFRKNGKGDMRLKSLHEVEAITDLYHYGYDLKLPEINTDS